MLIDDRTRLKSKVSIARQANWKGSVTQGHQGDSKQHQKKSEIKPKQDWGNGKPQARESLAAKFFKILWTGI